MSKIIVNIGISGSGKTTWSTNFIKENPSYLRVNRDDIRKQITGSDNLLLSKELEKLVSKIQDETIRTILLEGNNVILDNTHLQKKYLDEILLKYNHLADIEFKIFDIDRNEAIKRVCTRDNRQEAQYIKKQFNNFEKLVHHLSKYNYPKNLCIHEYNSYLDDCIICDLDGTLCLYGDKNSYYRDFENDQVNLPVLNIINNAAVDKIFFFSGRNGKYESQTRRFLDDYVLEDYTLVMRDSEDMRRDSIVKEEMFNNYIKDKYNVEFVIDDRLQVIEECWNKLDIFVLNVNQTNKRF